jgi:hypothetical protein
MTWMSATKIHKLVALLLCYLFGASMHRKIIFNSLQVQSTHYQSIEEHVHVNMVPKNLSESSHTRKKKMCASI